MSFDLQICDALAIHLPEIQASTPSVVSSATLHYKYMRIANNMCCL